jgi:hydrogenase expression/formation protein HypC
LLPENRPLSFEFDSDNEGESSLGDRDKLGLGCVIEPNELSEKRREAREATNLDVHRSQTPVTARPNLDSREMYPMCLAVPGKILSIEGEDLARTARVSFGGIIKQVNLAYVPEANVGDYAIVHVGFAISLLDETEALRTLEYLTQMGELAELQPQQFQDAYVPRTNKGDA